MFTTAIREDTAKLIGRNYFLARLHTIHPTPSYASAVKLLARSSSLVEQSRASLFETGITIEEPIIDIPSADVDKLASRISALNLAAKRALFAERVEKPVFFDTAFNYVELPLDELLVRAGKQPAVERSSSAQGSAAATVQDVAQSVASVAPAPVASAVKSIARATRESTPAVQTANKHVHQQREDEDEEDEDEDMEERDGQDGQQGQKKGWLGGWFGRK
jgi:signal recognition particle subunit SRP68